MDDGGFNLRPGVETSISMRKARMLPGKPGRRALDWRGARERAWEVDLTARGREGDHSGWALSMWRSTGAEIKGKGADRVDSRKGPEEWTLDESDEKGFRTCLGYQGML